MIMPIQTLEETMVPSSTHTERQLPHKATLYCQDCTHESPVTGDWIIHDHTTSLDYECPECGNTIQSRAAERELLTVA